MEWFLDQDHHPIDGIIHRQVEMTSMGANDPGRKSKEHRPSASNMTGRNQHAVQGTIWYVDRQNM
eukprot:6884824-Ditylum_brightwellii.AAC.2